MNKDKIDDLIKDLQRNPQDLENWNELLEDNNQKLTEILEEGSYLQVGILKVLAEERLTSYLEGGYEIDRDNKEKNKSDLKAIGLFTYLLLQFQSDHFQASELMRTAVEISISGEDSFRVSPYSFYTLEQIMGWLRLSESKVLHAKYRQI